MGNQSSGWHARRWGRTCAAKLTGVHALGCYGVRVWAQVCRCVCAALTQVETRPVRGCVVLQWTWPRRSGGGGTPCGVLATRVAYTPLQHAQKDEGHLEVLTKTRNRA